MYNLSPLVKAVKEFWLFIRNNNWQTFIYYLILFLLPTQFGKHFWPDFAFVSGLRIDYLSPTLYVTDILILFLVISVFIKSYKKTYKKLMFERGAWRRVENYFIDIPTSLSLRSKNKKAKVKKIWKSLIPNSLFLILFVIIVGIILSKNPLAGWYGFIKLLELIFFGYYVSKQRTCPERSRRVVLIFASGVLLESILVIGQFFHQGSLGGLFYFFGERFFNGQTPGIANASINGSLILRPYGTFSHPNVLAAYLLISLVIILSHLSSLISHLKKSLYLLIFCLGSIALFLTLSRVAIVLWIVIVLVSLIKYFSLNSVILNLIQDPEKNLSADKAGMPKRVRHDKIINPWLALLTKPFLLISLILFLVGFIFYNSPLFSRFFSLGLTDESVTQRILLMQNSLTSIFQHPLFGTGLNNYLNDSASLISPFSFLISFQPVHNIYLLIAQQTGVIGLTFFLWFVWKTIKRIQKNELRIKVKSSIIHNSRFIILVIVLFLGFFDHYFLTLQQGQLLFAFVFGLCWQKA